ncbi:MAG: lamin tail domain-containing protein [Candidatus Kapaibacterium sp.]|jgi:hypothetical protein
MTLFPIRYIILLFFVLMYSAQGQIVLSEFQPAPVTGNPEWIELYNSSTGTVQFDGYIHDRTTSIKVTFTAKGRSYIVLTRDTSSLRESHTLPSVNVLFVEIKTPTLNNTNDIIVLRNKDSVVIDSLWYSLKDARKGISFERVSMTLPAYLPSNLLQSIAPDSSTIGYVNSHTKVRKDLMLWKTSFDSYEKKLSITIKNNGLTNHRDSLPLRISSQSDSLHLTHILTKPLLPDSLSTMTVPFTALSALLKRYHVNDIDVNVLNVGDERLYNNSTSLPLYPPHSSRPLHINEFLYDEDISRPEFIEITNTSDSIVSLLHWQIHDNTGYTTSSNRHIINKPLTIAPNDYAVLCSDSSIFLYPNIDSAKVYILPKSLSLNNSGDDIVLRNPNGDIQDSLQYTANWKASSLSTSRGISVEKLSPSLQSHYRDSWVSCTNQYGATPTLPNSNLVEKSNGGTFTISPNPFSPYPPRYERTLLSYTTPFVQARLRILIFSKEGEEVRTLVNAPLTGKQGEYIWDGKDNDGNAVAVGIYVVYLEAINNDDNDVYIAKTTCVIGN